MPSTAINTHGDTLKWTPYLEGWHDLTVVVDSGNGVNETMIEQDVIADGGVIYVPSK